MYRFKNLCSRSNLHGLFRIIYHAKPVLQCSRDGARAHTHTPLLCLVCVCMSGKQRECEWEAICFQSSAWLPFTNSIHSDLIKGLWCLSDIRDDIHSLSVRLSEIHELLSLRSQYPGLYTSYGYYQKAFITSSPCPHFVRFFCVNVFQNEEIAPW